MPVNVTGIGLQDVNVQANSSGRLPLDLREHRPFMVDTSMDCCPSVTELTERAFAVNWLGDLVELFHSDTGVQQFYETVCLPHVKDRPCQFVSDRYVRRSRCVQQYSYAYAIGRALGTDGQFGIDLIRVEAGCKCRLDLK